MKAHAFQCDNRGFKGTQVFRDKLQTADNGWSLSGGFGETG